MTLELLGLLFGVVGLELVVRHPGRWWALVPWIIADVALMIDHWGKGNTATAVLFAYYLIRTACGAMTWRY